MTAQYRAIFEEDSADESTDEESPAEQRRRHEEVDAEVSSPREPNISSTSRIGPNADVTGVSTSAPPALKTAWRIPNLRTPVTLVTRLWPITALNFRPKCEDWGEIPDFIPELYMVSYI